MREEGSDEGQRTFDGLTIRTTAYAHLTRPFTAAAIVIAYFALPMMGLIDPVWLYIAGTMLGLGIGALTWGAIVVDGRSSEKTMVIGLGLATVAVFGLLLLSTVIQPFSTHIDRQCVLLEIDMLRLKHAREDSRELFTALKCRPEGVGKLILPAQRGFVERDGAIWLSSH